MVIDFPTREVAATAFLEQEYLDIIPLRDRVFSDFHMFLAQYGVRRKISAESLLN